MIFVPVLCCFLPIFKEYLSLMCPQAVSLLRLHFPLGVLIKNRNGEVHVCTLMTVVRYLVHQTKPSYIMALPTYG